MKKKRRKKTGCKTKLGHASAADAHAAMRATGDNQYARDPKYRPAVGLHVYWCGEHATWHVGHRRRARGSQQ